MPRKGGRKVRTGCITCKIRKVKCDETKPSCTRCTATGRVCDGYRPQVVDARKAAPERAISLYQPHRVFPGVTTPKEGQALQYFCEAAGPAMSGIVDPYFWTNLVMQLGAFEPAVKHALVAISSLSEQANGPQDITPAQRLIDQGQALHHYNAAIRQLKAKDSEDKQIVVLVVCILFICIEALRSDVQSAVRHCRHGIEIMKAALPGHPCIKDHLLPIFRRLSISAFYFSDNDGTFLDMPDLWEPPQRFFSTLDDAQRMFDVIIARISHLTLLIAEAGQQTDSQQVRTSTDTPNADEHRAEQANINRLLEEWLGLFAELMARIHHAEASGKRLSPKEQYERKVQQVFMLTRYEAGRIWVEMAFDRNVPGARERFLPNFQRVLKQLQWLESQMPEDSRSAAAGQRSPQFSFEMGFTAVIFYFVSACPYVEMRLELMRLMRLFGLPKENLWDREVLLAAGRKIIEEENGVKLEDSDRPLALLSSPRPIEEISTECSPGASDPTPSPPASAISPLESDSPRSDSCTFVFNKTLQSHPWCSMPWSIQIGPKESTGSQEETEIIP